MKINYQTGSAHVVVVVCLVLALLTALGWIFWQNFMMQQPKNTKTELVVVPKSDTVKDVALKTISINDAFDYDMSFKYPETWIVERSTSGPIPLDESASTGETIVVTSPTKKLSVRYQLAANGGLGGTCDEASVGNISTSAYDALSGWPESGFVVLSGSSKRNGAVDSFNALLTELADAKGYASGDSMCEFIFDGIITLRKKDNLTLIDASIDFDNADIKSMKDFKMLQQTDEFEQAKAILISTSA